MKIAFCGDSYCTDIRENTSWPNLVAKEFDAEILCGGQAGACLFHIYETMLEIIDEADYIIFCVTEPFRLATRYKLPITVEWHGLTTLDSEEFESTRSPGPGLDANTRIESIKKMQSISRAVNDYYNILMDYDYHTVVQRGLLREIDALIKEKEKKCIFFSCFSESFCDYTFESGGWGNKNLYDLGVNGSDVDALNHMDEKGNYNMFRVVRDIINDGNFNPREINMDKYFSKNQKHAWGLPIYFRSIRDRF